MSEYYTPEISELHEGLECEMFVNDSENRWHKAVIKIDDKKGQLLCFAQFPDSEAAYITPIRELLNEEQVRVKYLDHEDIIDCGWQQRLSESNLYYLGEGREYDMQVTKIGKYRIIENGHDPDDSEVLYYGNIKNVSELKRIMKMIGI